MRLLRHGQPADPPPSALEQALARQILSSERLRMALAAGLAGSLSAPLLIGAVFFPEHLQALSHGYLRPLPVLGLLGAVLAYLLIGRAQLDHYLRTDRQPPARSWRG